MTIIMIGWAIFVGVLGVKSDHKARQEQKQALEQLDKCNDITCPAEEQK